MNSTSSCFDVFQGYNEMRQQEKEFLYEMELLKQKGENENK